MAHQDQEVEIKIKVSKTDFSQAKKIAQKIAHQHQSSRQIDTYYSPAHKDYLKIKYPFEWLRIGQRGNNTILNYKHFYPENKEIFTHCNEYETRVDSNNKLSKIFKALDLKKLITIDKKRITFVYLNQFEIAFDQVKNLGYFIEIEALKKFGSIKKTNQKLVKFAKKLKINHLVPEKRGYPYLLLKKKKQI